MQIDIINSVEQDLTWHAKAERGCYVAGNDWLKFCKSLSNYGKL